jgi:hypothetical protein
VFDQIKTDLSRQKTILDDEEMQCAVSGENEVMIDCHDLRILRATFLQKQMKKLFSQCCFELGTMAI